MSERAQGAEEREVLAGELVLGLLDTAERERLLAAAERDPALAAAIAAWNTRLEPLVGPVAPAPPSAGLWTRIAADMSHARPLPPPGPHASPLGWQLAAALGFGLAGLLAAWLLSNGRLEINVRFANPEPVPAGRSAPVAPMMVPQPPKQAAPAPTQAQLLTRPAKPPAPTIAPALPPEVVAEASRPRALALLSPELGRLPSMKVMAGGGTLRLELLRRVFLPASEAIGVWIWPRGESAPILVGKLGTEGGVLHFPFAVEDGTPVMAAAESRRSGSIGEPGPTLAQGQFVVAD